MDEKERQEIRDRGTKYANTWRIDEPERSRLITAHTQGALDQDPISRKKRTQEILLELNIECDEYEPNGEAWNIVQDCIKRIIALP